MKTGMMIFTAAILFTTLSAQAAIDCSQNAAKAALAVNNLTIPNSSVYQIQQGPNTNVGNLQYQVLIKENSGLMSYVVEASNGIETKECRILKVITY